MPQCGARWGTVYGRLLLCGFASILLTRTLRGQSTTQGVVGGLVTDPTGVVVSQAEIDLTDPDTGHIYQASTDA